MNEKLFIKLISPRMTLRPMDSDLKRLMSPSLSLIMVASLTPKIHRVVIEDENLQKINFSDQPDIVGININVDTANRAFDIAQMYRKKGIKVIFGGIHASANPHEMLQYCDSVVIGDAEKLWSQLLDDFQNNRLQPIYQNENPVDLSLVPIPEWNFVNTKNYLYHNIVATSRGCPFKCDFCYNSSEYIKNPFRYRPNQQVIQEILALKTKQVMFIDDNFIGDVSRAKELVQAMRPLQLIWHAAVSVNLLHHKELIRNFAESGCRSLFIGFESINSDSIQSVHKRQNKISDYEELIDLLHQHGIMVNASLVFGFDHDTAFVFQQTLNWLVKNKVETMTAHILTPYPGTVFYKKILSENRIIDFNTSKYNTSNVVFQPKLMTAEQLRNGYLWMYDEFYSLKNMLKRKPINKKLLIPYFLFNFGYRKYGRLTAFLGKLGFMQSIGILARKLAYGID
jgi:radical SAM superfamily enzyme YgiQ (UPF0313 family)